MAWTVERMASVPSTMDVARAKARDGAPDGTVIVAEEMTSGRGTHGRSWCAPKGGLYLSMVLREVADPHLLTLALGNAVCETLEVAGLDPRLKWVNDVLVPDPTGKTLGKKVAGILVEGESTGSRLDFLVAGIGVNVNGTAGLFPADLQPIATTVEQELSCESCIPDLETLLLESVESWVRRVREGRDAEILDAFRARDALAGKPVVLVDGATQMAGTAAGLDGKGRLLVRGPDGRTHPFATGTVRLA